LTVRDHIELYGEIKGIDRGIHLDQAVSNLISKLGLAEYEFSKIKYLSGGYKRRVSLGIALIGNPVLLLLDEPTCGMDPIARRETWNVIKSVALNSASVVLTTHSMEEAESISTRVGIMSRGKMICLGSVESLRRKFSNGIEIFIQTKFVDTKILTVDNSKSFISICEEHSVKRAKRFMSSGLCVLSNSAIAFSLWWAQEEVNDTIEEQIASVVTDQEAVISSVNASGRSIRMVLVPCEMTLSFLISVFGLLSSMRIEGDIVDFSVNQNSLEQVFNSITAVEADVNGNRDQSTEQVSQLE
jgi:ABC-type multidrug transport system ATPase subunit